MTEEKTIAPQRKPIRRIHPDDYVNICHSCPLPDCTNDLLTPGCPLQARAQRDKARSVHPVDPRWLTVRQLAQALDIPAREITVTFHEARSRGEIIIGRWQRGQHWYYDSRRLDYYRRLLTSDIASDGHDRPPLAIANSYDDPHWIQS